jgi:hypothetical protein
VIGPEYIFYLLIPGPVVGLWMLKPMLKVEGPVGQPMH